MPKGVGVTLLCRYGRLIPQNTSIVISLRFFLSARQNMKLYTILETLLKSNANNLNLIDNQGDLMLNKIHHLVDKIDENLIGLLLENQELREKFFLKIKAVYIFKASDFKFFLDENKIDNSYTQYENRIGLTAGGKFLKDNSDVFLDFPYKDCILEGGQSTEEGTDTYFEWDEKDNHYIEKQAKRKEIFFNTILAKDEIDRLLEPKAFTNIKKHNQNGVEFPSFGGVPNGRGSFFNRDENGTIKDNLIIKGNNLLALHTLKNEFAGKVKLIYIDPPYNTGNDSFAYNDNFNHSTWLTFMRNRLLIAKELLREDGVIFVHCDDNEQAYLKILMDDIFKKAPSGKSNYIQLIEIKANVGAANEFQNPFMPKNCEYGLYYAKNYDIRRYKQLWMERDYDEAYSKIILNFDEIDYTKWEISSVKKELEKEFNLKYNYIPKIKIIDFVIKNSNRIFQNIGVKGAGIGLNKAMKESETKVWSIYKREIKDDIICYKGRMVRFYSNNIKNIDGKNIIVKELGSLWDDLLWNGIANEGGVILKNGKKPEKLLKRIIEMATNEKDIVMDYHLGSGTTSAVAHKMKRQYIGIEQLDYGENDSVLRLQNVINNDQSGISKSVNWQGGGSFVYLELTKNNQNAIEHIQDCKNYEELLAFFDEMCHTYFLHYNVKVKEFREKICKEENFRNLTLDKQKIMFAKMLDLNQLYVNVSDMEDKKFTLSESDIAVTKDFYQI